MTLLFKRGTIVFSTILILLAASPTYPGNFAEDDYGVVTDPLGVKKASADLSASLERTLIQLRELEGVANNHVAERLEQIRSILKDVVSGANDTITKAISQMRDLEMAVNKDAIRLIYRVQCATEVALMDQMQRAFAKFISNLKKANPGISVAGITIIKSDLTDIEIVDPDIAYLSTKSILMSKLDHEIKEDSNAYLILSAYQNLERGARFARCHYIGQGLETRWVEEVNELERLSAPWLSIARPSMTAN